MAKTDSTRPARKSKKKTVRPRQNGELEYWKGRCADLERALNNLRIRDGIVLEVYVNEGGFVDLRDKVSKLPIKYIEDIEVVGDSRRNEELQRARIEVVVDPRLS